MGFGGRKRRESQDNQKPWRRGGSLRSPPRSWRASRARDSPCGAVQKLWGNTTKIFFCKKNLWPTTSSRARVGTYSPSTLPPLVRGVAPPWFCAS